MRKTTWKDLMDVAMGERAYETWSERASAMLNLVGFEDVLKNSLREREVRMEYLITHFGASGRVRKNVTPPLGAGLGNDRYNEIAMEVAGSVNQLSAALVRANGTPRKTARGILRFLDGLLNSEKRAVAFAILLRRPVIPYVRIPPAYLAVGPVPAYRFSERTTQSAFILQRLVRDDKLSSLEKMTAIERVFRRHGRARDRGILFLNLMNFIEQEFMRRLTQEQEMRARAVSSFLGSLGGAIPLSLGELPPELRALFEDKECPVHGAEHKKELKNKPS